MPILLYIYWLNTFSEQLKVLWYVTFLYIDAVYSEDLTTHTDGTVTKIPYFTLMKRIFDERDDKQDLLSEQLEEVKRR